MAPSDVGGRAALAGFVYQLLATSSMAIESCGAIDSNDEQASAILAIHPGAKQIEPEAHGQDALVTFHTGEGVPDHVLVQFKYSARPSRRQIKPKELAEIVRRLSDSSKELQDSAPSHVALALVTNRRLSPNSVKAQEAARSGAAAAGVRAFDDCLLPALSDLRIEQLDADGLYNSLRTRCTQLGMLPHEVPDAVARVVKFVIDASVSLAPPMHSDSVDEILANFPRPTKISPSALADRMRHDLAQFALDAQVPPDLNRRDVLDQIRSALAEPLVLATGVGGCGKTSAIVRVLRDLLLDPVRHYVAARAASELRTDWLSSLIADWRGGAAHAGPESTKTSLDRLRSAKGEVDGPTLFLLLDGLDEAVHAASDLQAVVREALRLAHLQSRTPGDPPQLVMIATARSTHDVESVWPRGSEAVSSGEVRCVPISNYSPQELREAADRLRPGLGKRFSPPDLPPESAGHAAPEAAKLTPLGPTDAIPAIVQSTLSRPIMWACFSGLAPTRQDEVLDGKSAGLVILWEAYLNEFLARARRRLVVIPSHHIREMLGIVASTSSEPSTGYPLAASWIAPATANGRFEARHAQRLYDEACSFGLVIEERPGVWEWDPPVVAEYLRIWSNGGVHGE